MSNKINKHGKFNGRYMDYCEEFDPSKADIAEAGENTRNWDSFEVPGNEPEHIAKPDKDVDLSDVLKRAKAMRIGRGILSAARLA